jgi:hypothetical protein
MDAVTAAKIHTVKEKLLSLGNPWKLTARAMKKPVKNGPVSDSFPVTYKNRKMAKQRKANAIRIFEIRLFLFIKIFNVC